MHTACMHVYAFFEFHMHMCRVTPQKDSGHAVYKNVKLNIVRTD